MNANANLRRRVVFHTEIDVLLDTESEVTYALNHNIIHKTFSNPIREKRKKKQKHSSK